MSTNYATEKVSAAVISLARRVASVVGGMASTVIRWFFDCLLGLLGYSISQAQKLCLPDPATMKAKTAGEPRSHPEFAKRELLVGQTHDFHRFVEAVKQIGAFWGVVNEPPPHSARKAE